MPEHSPEPHWINVEKDVHIHLYYGNEKIEDSAERFIGCYNACRGLNPEVVPELVGMVERLVQCGNKFIDAPGYYAIAGASPDFRVLIANSEELLAKVKA